MEVPHRRGDRRLGRARRRQGDLRLARQLFVLFESGDHSLVWKPFQTENFINCSTAIEDNNTFIAGCDTKVRVINILSGKEVSEVPLGEGAYLIAPPPYWATSFTSARTMAGSWRSTGGNRKSFGPSPTRTIRSSTARRAVTDKFVILGGREGAALSRPHRREPRSGALRPGPVSKALPWLWAIASFSAPATATFTRSRLTRQGALEVPLRPLDHRFARRWRTLPGDRIRRTGRNRLLFRLEGDLRRPGRRSVDDAPRA